MNVTDLLQLINYQAIEDEERRRARALEEEREKARAFAEWHCRQSGMKFANWRAKEDSKKLKLAVRNEDDPPV